MSEAPRSTAEAVEFFKQQRAIDSRAWKGYCLMLQRMARGIPAVYPSAISAAAATPKEDRVTKVADLRRGMVAYSDDPNDGNIWGHIYFIAGWNGPRDDARNLLTWSNDVVNGKPGAVGLVPITFYRANWGDGFQFGATSLNGWDLPEFDDAPPKPKPAFLGDPYTAAIKRVANVRKRHLEIARDLGPERGARHAKLADGLAVDLERMRRRRQRWSRDAA